MADIKQAAKWLQEGKKIKDPVGFVVHLEDYLFLAHEDKSQYIPSVTDLLSNEWEIFTWAN